MPSGAMRKNQFKQNVTQSVDHKITRKADSNAFRTLQRWTVIIADVRDARFEKGTRPSYYLVQ